MATTRRRLIAGTTVLVLLAGLAIGRMVWRQLTVPAPVLAYERIRVGMSLAEVEKAIGASKPHYRSGSVETWMWDQCWISVEFDEKNGKVLRADLCQAGPPPTPYSPTFFERMRAFIGL
jgi:hypothetical protein